MPKLKPTRIDVQIDDLTWDNFDEKIMPARELEAKLWHCIVGISLTKENFEEMFPENEGTPLILCGFPITLR